MASDAAPTRKQAKLSASFTIQPEHLRVAEPDAPEASLEADWPWCYQPIRLIIRWATPRMSHRSWPTPSIGCGAANSMGYLTSVLLRSLEQGPIEERLAKIEAALAANAAPTKGAYADGVASRS